MRTKIIIFVNVMNIIDKIKKYFLKNIKEKQKFKLKYILNVCLLQSFKF